MIKFWPKPNAYILTNIRSPTAMDSYAYLYSFVEHRRRNWKFSPPPLWIICAPPGTWI